VGKTPTERALLRKSAPKNWEGALPKIGAPPLSPKEKKYWGEIPAPLGHL